MRAVRLVAATLYLQRRGRVTAAELADHLEVSVATARRDLGALSAAGVPVHPQPGRGGGWQLVGGARTDLTGLTEPEVRALFLALAPADLGHDAAAGAVLAKLVRALPASFRASAEIATSALRRDATGWEQRVQGALPAVRELCDAILRRRPCTLDYRRRGAPAASRVAVEPWRLVDKAGVAYLLAGSDRGPRTYRVDRIDAVTVHQEQSFERPEDPDIDDLWQRSVDAVVAARTGVTARVQADPTALAVLADQFGTAFTTTDTEGEALVSAHSARGLAERLAGWGSRVLVLGPPAVVAELRAIATELLAAYEHDAGVEHGAVPVRTGRP